MTQSSIARHTKIILASLFGTIIFALVIITIIKTHIVVQLHAREKLLKEEVSIIPGLEQQKGALTKTNDSDAKKLEKIVHLEQAINNNPQRYLQLIAQIIPDAVRLNSFKIERHIIHMGGIAKSLSGVQKFVQALQKSEIFSTPQIVGMEDVQEKSSKESFVRFTLTAKGL